MNVSRICSNIATKNKVLCNNAKEKRAIVERASQIYGYSSTQTKVKKVSSAITGYIAPILKKVKEESPSITGLTETFSAIKKNISRAKKAPENEGLSNIRKTLRGLKNSKGEVAHSLGDVIGVNDVILAKQEAGTTKAVLEGGKSALRVLLSTALGGACVPLPVPGAMVGGWFAGEKIAEKIVGKPFSKQIAKLK